MRKHPCHKIKQIGLEMAGSVALVAIAALLLRLWLEPKPVLYINTGELDMGLVDSPVPLSPIMHP